MPKLYTVEEMCVLLKISRTTFLKERKKGMPYIVVGNMLRFSYEDVLEWYKEAGRCIGETS